MYNGRARKSASTARWTTKKTTSNYILVGLNFVDAMELRMQYQLYDCVQSNNELHSLCSTGEKMGMELKKTTLILFQAEFAYFSCMHLFIRCYLLAWVQPFKVTFVSFRFMLFFSVHFSFISFWYNGNTVGHATACKLKSTDGIVCQMVQIQIVLNFAGYVTNRGAKVLRWLFRIYYANYQHKKIGGFFFALLWNIIPFWIPSHFAISLSPSVVCKP